MGDAEFFQNGVGFLLGVAFVVAAGATRHDNRLQRVQMHTGGQRLRQINHLLGAFGGHQRHQVFAIQRQHALRRVEIRQRAQQRRFTRTVGTEQGGNLAAGQNWRGQTVDDFLFAIPGMEVANREAIHYSVPRWRIIMLRKKGTPTSEVTMPTGIMTPVTIFLDTTDASDSTSAPISMLPGR